jgi:hypothetical protein
MNRGYTFLWRKTWANPVLCEPGKKFSRFEAWLYLTNVLAAGMDDEAAGLKRGEFGASARYLAQKWNWPRSTVQRFFKELEAAGMISRLEDPSCGEPHQSELGPPGGTVSGPPGEPFYYPQLRDLQPRAGLRTGHRSGHFAGQI